MKIVWRIVVPLVIVTLAGVALQMVNRSGSLDAAPGPVTVAQPITPPPPQAELMPPEPSKEHVWIPGNWERAPDKWVWVQGRWIKPPILPARWVNGYWMLVEGQYHWHPGHWAAGGSGIVVNKPCEPPAALQEVPPPPSPGQTWVAGRWEWSGHWAWTPGYFSAKPTPTAAWVSGHWAKGLLGLYRWIPAHWENG